MRIPLSWLKDYLDTSASVDEIVTKLDQLGHEVEEVETTGPNFTGVVVGKIVSREQHPEADRLGVCMVDVGAEEQLQIVCGAPNARAGITVPVALNKAVLPGNFKIKKSKLRGVVSNGMICSSRELELGDEHDGIMELETDAALGTNFADTLNDGETIIELSITPNRGDCFSVLGIARELAAAGLGELKLPDIPAQVGSKDITINAESTTDGCPYFTGIELTGLQNTESPAWLKQRLEALGLRPRSALVDITNYVMFGLGQPLHAYDADKLQGKLIIHDATKAEIYHGIATDRPMQLEPGDLVIYDDSGLIDLAGITGSAGTAVSDETTRVYLEAAYFDRKQIALTGQRLGVHTDARKRFERGVDPQMVAAASRYAAQLMLEICGGEASAQEVVGTPPSYGETFEFDPAFIKQFVGIELPKEQIERDLTALGFDVKASGSSYTLTPPSWRTYMHNDADVVEELLRLHDYEKVPATLPRTVQAQEISDPELKIDRFLRRQLAAYGFQEVITYSFISEKAAQQFGSHEDPLIAIRNPLDEENMTHMRTSLLPGLLATAQRNEAYTTPVTHIFEVGHVWRHGVEMPSCMGLLLPDHQRHWQQAAQQPTAYDAKAYLFELLNSHNVATEKLQLQTVDLPEFLHPGRSATVSLGPNMFGYFGELHPLVLKEYDLKGPAAVFALFPGTLLKLKAKPKAYQHSIYQPVERDIALLVADDLPAGKVVQTVQNAVKELATSVDLFDVYQGDKLPAGKKSLGVTMTFQAPDRTLSEREINAEVEKAVQACAQHYQAELRDA